MQAFRTFLGDTDMLAYLSMMAPRLVELRQALKPTGSIYLHCDPTASHYLKMLMDVVFGPQNFRNEVIWKRTAAHSAAKRWNDVHDTLLFYSRSDVYTWNTLLLSHSTEYTARYKRADPDGQFWTDDNLTGPGIRHGDSGAVWRGYDPTEKGVHWKVNLKVVQMLVGQEQARHISTTEKLDLLDTHGFILWPKKRSGAGVGFPRFKRYLGAGQPIQDIITDIPPINSQAQERMGYPTQKPVTLLERIILASSHEGDIVLDPFCGCGTTIDAAQRLKREWIGIDITYLATALIKHRLLKTFGPQVRYRVRGEPTSVLDAEALAAEDRFEFQCWALSLVGARPVEPKKGADQGIDGRLFFHDEGQHGRTKQVILSVKSGAVSVKDVRDLRGVIEREKAQIGVLITLREPTRPMRTEAASGAFYKSQWGNHPRLQLLTIADLFEAKGIDYPGWINTTFRSAQRPRPQEYENLEMPLERL
jgi:hypothetical protein